MSRFPLEVHADLGKHRLYRQEMMRFGLALLFVWFLFSTFVPWMLSLVRFSPSEVLPFWLGLGSTGLAGFALLVLSTFLPSKRTDKPTFIQELMSKEKLQYGVYTEGNWRSVLDDEDRRKKKQG